MLRPVIEALRGGTLRTLDDLYGKFTLTELAAAADSLDEFCKERFLQAANEHSQALFNMRQCAESAYLLDQEENLYRLQMADDVIDFASCLASISYVVPTQATLSSYSVKINSTGRYRSLTMYFPSNLKWQKDHLDSLVGAVFETAYGWFRNQIESLIVAERSRLAANAYRKLRDLFPSPAVHQQLWLAAVTTDRGFRLLDPTVTAAAFATIDEHSSEWGYSTNRLAAELVTTTLERSKLLMTRALTSRTCVDVSLEDAIYRREGSSYANALAALYGCTSFSIYPILISEDINIVALFPTDLRSTIEEILRHHVGEVREECERSLSVVKATQVLLTQARRSLPYGSIGETLGGMLKGFTS